MRVLLLASITMDGKIARSSSELTTWSSREDKRLFVRTTKEAGVIIMGRSTYETLPAPLPGRLHIVLTSNPPEDGPPEVEFTADPPARILERLAERGYSAAVVSGGAHTYRAFLDAGLVDEIWLTVEPLAIGAGISLFGDEPLEARCELLECARLGEHEVHLKYRVVR